MPKTQSPTDRVPYQTRTLDTAGRSAYDSLLPIRLRIASDLMEECARLILTGTHFLGSTELRVLGYLAERDEASVGEVSRDLKVDKAWISRLLVQLGERSLVARTGHRSDSRVVLVSLTDRGRALFEAIMSAVKPHYAAMAQGVDEAAALTFLDTLECNLTRLNAQLRAG